VNIKSNEFAIKKKTTWIGTNCFLLKGYNKERVGKKYTNMPIKWSGGKSIKTEKSEN
jgi:hypothetical protein